MRTPKDTPVIDRLVSGLGECLTPESARRLLNLRADASLQAVVDDLADRHSQGMLSPQEAEEYSSYVAYNTFVAILKSKARQILVSQQGSD
jgi:hypothetical protein